MVPCLPAGRDSDTGCSIAVVRVVWDHLVRVRLPAPRLNNVKAGEASELLHLRREEKGFFFVRKNPRPIGDSLHPDI